MRQSVKPTNESMVLILPISIWFSQAQRWPQLMIAKTTTRHDLLPLAFWLVELSKSFIPSVGIESVSSPRERRQNMKHNTSSRKLGTDFARLDAMRDEEIDLSDSPEVPPEMFARGLVRKGLKPVVRKQQLTLQLDSDVLAWFKKQGRDYQAKMNALLRAHMVESQAKTPRSKARANRV